ncbi:MAG: ATP-binding protein [Chloroflexi bacterium]|nr:ATP-binding protein [Chloroflexota bacterium]MDE2675074.1 ATP-binding protein [Paracoccaceae bacterium]
MPHINRHIRKRLTKALDVSPVVYLNGPRQAGKTSLFQTMAKDEYPAKYRTFDSPMQMAVAINTPEGYLKETKVPLIIDEVHLVPEIFRPLKIVVDQLRQEHGPKPNGRYLIAGPMHIMALPKLSDPLVGRMNVLTLYPFSSSEALGCSGDFIGRLFNKDFNAYTGNQKLSDVIYKSTYPEISGASDHELTRWFDDYLSTILQRDIHSLAKIAKPRTIPNLFRILANRAGSLVNDADIARDAGLNHVTTRNYKTLLRMLYLTFEIAPWYRNIGKRLVKAPKGYLIDTLLLCYLLGYELDDLAKNQPVLFDHVLENFVATELLKLMSFHDKRMDLFHFSTSDKKEVDFVIEKSNGQLAAIEVKHRDYLSNSDFKGLRELQRLTGDDFICGIVLYRGRDVVPFGQNLWAIPINNLWG